LHETTTPAAVAPLLTTTLTGTNAIGATIRRVAPPPPRALAPTTPGGSDKSGKPTLSTCTPVSCSYVLASSAMPRSFAISDDCSAHACRAARSSADSPSSSSSPARRGIGTRAINFASSSLPSRRRSASSGETSFSFASSVQSTRWRLECGRQFRLGPFTSAANNRSSILSRMRFFPAMGEVITSND
jgi:hypothetical protein